MAAQKRKPDPDLKERLFDEFYRFSFFHAVGLIEKLFPEKDPVGKHLVPAKEALRFSVKPGFSFPPSEISSLSRPDKGRPANMGIAFMGLIGPSGVLPYWYNEIALERNRNKDYSLTAFLDIFHHRLISLFYLAWKKNRFPENYLSGARDRHSRYLLSLSGLGTSGLTDMIGLPEESLSFYTGLTSKTVPSATSIEATVAYLSGTDVRVEQFVERTIELSEEDRTSLGMANIQLGIDTVCGIQARDCQTKFRLHLGPMDFRTFQRFLPDGDMLSPIFALVKYMVGIEYEFDLRIILPRENAPACRLGEKALSRLGWSTWLLSPGALPENDISLTLNEESILSV